MSGWVKLHRSIINWEWFTDDNVFAVFIQILLRANYKETKWRGEIIKEGQLLTGRKQIAKWTRLSESKIRTALEKLKSTNEITIQATSQYSVITVVNWDKYQVIDQPIANQSPTNRQPIATSKKVKKEKNIYTQAIEEIYQRYPKKEEKAKGIKFMSKMIKTDKDLENFSKAVDNYNLKLDTDGTPLQFTKHFYNFAQCWEDFVTMEPVRPHGKSQTLGLSLRS